MSAAAMDKQKIMMTIEHKFVNLFGFPRDGFRRMMLQRFPPMLSVNPACEHRIRKEILSKPALHHLRLRINLKRKLMVFISCVNLFSTPGVNLCILVVDLQRFLHFDVIRKFLCAKYSL